MVDRLVNSEENARRISQVESRFGSSGVPLAITGRVLVGEGVLTKMCRKGPKARQFFLFNDILVYGNIVLGKKMFNKQHIMPLEEVSLEKIPDNGQYQNGWMIRTTTKSFVVYAATAGEKHDWMAHINKCVQDLLRKSGKKPVEKHAAVWVPDADASICMHCNKTQFTIIVRRHHCRNCGAVVCKTCSSKKFLLPQQSSKPVRVCTACYERLSNAVKIESSKTALVAGSVGTSRVGASDTNYLLQRNQSAADSSGDDDSDDEGGTGRVEEYVEPRFYGDNTISADNSSISATSHNNNINNNNNISDLSENNSQITVRGGASGN